MDDDPEDCAKRADVFPGWFRSRESHEVIDPRQKFFDPGFGSTVGAFVTSDRCDTFQKVPITIHDSFPIVTDVETGEREEKGKRK